MLKSLGATSLKSATLATGLTCTARVMAVDLTVVSFGGANKSAQIKASYEPYQKAIGNRIVAGEYNGEMAKVKIMVDTSSVPWDLVGMKSSELSCGYNEGLFEEFSPTQSGKTEDFVPGTIQPCGMDFFVWSTAFAYNVNKLKSAPIDWTDFWDIKKFPGRRDLRKGAKYILEFALTADGMVLKDVYGVLATKGGQGRALERLDEIRSSVQQWEAGAQPPQYLASGDIVMSPTYNDRIVAVQKGSNLKVIWNGGIYDFDARAIPKGMKKQGETLRLIAFSVRPQQQKTYSEDITYGPANKQVVPPLNKALLKDMPTTPENIQNQVATDVTFWADYDEQLEQRFNVWAAR